MTTEGETTTMKKTISTLFMFGVLLTTAASAQVTADMPVPVPIPKASASAQATGDMPVPVPIPKVTFR